MTRQEAKALRARYVAEAQAKAQAEADRRRKAAEDKRAREVAEARALARWEASVRHDMARRAHRTADHPNHVLHRPHAWHRTATPPPPPTPTPTPRPCAPRSGPVRGMGLALLVGALLGGAF